MLQTILDDNGITVIKRVANKKGSRMANSPYAVENGIRYSWHNGEGRGKLVAGAIH